MAKQKPTSTKEYIRYWHPRKGGWYHARLVRMGRKWATVEPLAAAPNGIIIGFNRRRRVPAADVREAVL